MSRSEEFHASQTYYRAHPNDRPFSPEDATSREWATDDEPDPGYSTFEKPEHLFGYFNPGERDDSESHIRAFSGHRVGTGMDGEPLVVPHSTASQKLSWAELANRVGTDKVQDIDRRNGWDHRANPWHAAHDVYMAEKLGRLT